jgi:hypothetical protein
LNIFRRSARLVDSGDSFLKVHAGFECTENLITSTKYTVKQSELLREQLEHPLIRRIPAIQKIHDNNIVLLAVSMASSNPLFNSLGVPREVVVDNKGAELKVHPFRCRLRCNQD